MVTRPFPQYTPKYDLLTDNPYSCVFYGDLYPNRECYKESTAQGLKSLMYARKEFAYGPSQDYFESPSCIGFVRKGDASHGGCVVLISKSSRRTGFVQMLVVLFFFPLITLPTLKDRFRIVVFHSNGSRGGKVFPQKVRGAFSDGDRSTAPVPNMLDYSKLTSTSKSKPMDGESSRAGWGHSKYGFRAKRSSSKYSYTDSLPCGKSP